MPKCRFTEPLPSGARSVEVVDLKGVRHSSAAEATMNRMCFKCHDVIGTKPFHLIDGREIHEACTKAL